MKKNTKKQQSSPRDYRQEVAEMLQLLTVEVAKQLLLQVGKGGNLRAAIDFLRLNKVQVSDHELIKAASSGGGSPNELLDNLILEIRGGEGAQDGKTPKRNRQ